MHHAHSTNDATYHASTMSPAMLPAMHHATNDATYHHQPRPPTIPLPCRYIGSTLGSGTAMAGSKKHRHQCWQPKRKHCWSTDKTGSQNAALLVLRPGSRAPAFRVGCRSLLHNHDLSGATIRSSAQSFLQTAAIGKQIKDLFHRVLTETTYSSSYEAKTTAVDTFRRVLSTPVFSTVHLGPNYDIYIQHNTFSSSRRLFLPFLHAITTSPPIRSG
ncbi:hypothetical protein QBC40DRAFT_33927 [Triangularia verruculosa]|uniref:Uncharacterized protein n=1 Tax=Triangularia verruculosa TaxID=2587418 RepID=A0AAN7AX54_9PEZI|nr:hypothetical protein QBC40DRAFT_33927 [Triangularia verruculosa]